MLQPIKLLEGNVSKTISISFAYPNISSIVCLLMQNAIQQSPKRKIEIQLSLAPFWQISCRNDGEEVNFSNIGDQIESLSYLGILKIESNNQVLTKKNEVVEMNNSITKGNIVSLSDFYKYIPIRRASLLSDFTLMTEIRDIQRILRALSLLCPNLNIVFRFRKNFDVEFQQMLRLHPTNSISSRFEQLYGISIDSTAFIFIKERVESTFKLSGFIQKQSCSTKPIQHIFINGTLFNPMNADEQEIAKRQIYNDFYQIFIKTSMFSSRIYVFDIWTASQTIDRTIMEKMGRRINDLMSFKNSTHIDADDNQQNEKSINSNFQSRTTLNLNSTGQSAKEFEQKLLIRNKTLQERIKDYDRPLKRLKSLGDQNAPNFEISIVESDLQYLVDSPNMSLQILNQVDKKYIACMNQNSSNLILVDQHAAHERIRFEKMLSDYLLHCVTKSQDNVISYKKMFKYPKIVQLMQEGGSDVIELLQFWGMNMEICTLQNHIHLKYMPSILNFQNENEIMIFLNQLCFWMESLVAEKKLKDLRFTLNENIISSSQWLLAFRHAPPMIVDRIASLSCRGAIMFNDALSKQQCCQLIENLRKCTLPWQCAHGRPSAVVITDLSKLQDEISENSTIDWSILR